MTSDSERTRAQQAMARTDLLEIGLIYWSLGIDRRVWLSLKLSFYLRDLSRSPDYHLLDILHGVCLPVPLSATSFSTRTRFANYYVISVATWRWVIHDPACLSFSLRPLKLLGHSGSYASKLVSRNVSFAAVQDAYHLRLLILRCSIYLLLYNNSSNFTSWLA